jgi:uncharacterized protein
MFRSALAAVLAVAVVTAPAIAPAQEVVTITVTRAHVDLAKRYIEVAKLERQLDAVTETMHSVAARSMVRELALKPGSTDARAIEVLMDQVGAATAESMRPRFMERMAESFAATYSEEELNGLIAFYSSPIGKTITSKSPTLAPAASEHMQAFLPEIDVEFERQLCKRIGCEDTSEIKL